MRCSPVVVDDETDGFKEDSILGIGVLDLLGLGWLLGLVEYSLQALNQTSFHCCIFCGEKQRVQRPGSSMLEQVPAKGEPKVHGSQ